MIGRLGIDCQAGIDRRPERPVLGRIAGPQRDAQVVRGLDGGFESGCERRIREPAGARIDERQSCQQPCHEVDLVLVRDGRAGRQVAQRQLPVVGFGAVEIDHFPVLVPDRQGTDRARIDVHDLAVRPAGRVALDVERAFGKPGALSAGEANVDARPIGVRGARPGLADDEVGEDTAVSIPERQPGRPGARSGVFDGKLRIEHRSRRLRFEIAEAGDFGEDRLDRLRPCRVAAQSRVGPAVAAALERKAGPRPSDLDPGDAARAAAERGEHGLASPCLQDCLPVPPVDGNAARGHRGHGGDGQNDQAAGRHVNSRLVRADRGGSGAAARRGPGRQGSQRPTGR